MTPERLTPETLERIREIAEKLARKYFDEAWWPMRDVIEKVTGIATELALAHAREKEELERELNGVLAISRGANNLLREQLSESLCALFDIRDNDAGHSGTKAASAIFKINEGPPNINSENAQLRARVEELEKQSERRMNGWTLAEQDAKQERDSQQNRIAALQSALKIATEALSGGAESPALFRVNWVAALVRSIRVNNDVFDLLAEDDPDALSACLTECDLLAIAGKQALAEISRLQ